MQNKCKSKIPNKSIGNGAKGLKCCLIEWETHG